MTAPSDKQIEWLNKKGITVPATKEEASKLLDEAFKKGDGEKKPYTPKAKAGVKKVYPEGDILVDAVALQNNIFASAYAQTKKLLPEQDESSYEFNVTFGMVSNQLTQIITSKNY